MEIASNRALAASLLLLSVACNSSVMRPNDQTSDVFANGETTGETPGPPTFDSKRHSRPNIVFIMADDHSQKGVSAYGHALMPTPHIDRIAREGMRFNHAVVANAICAPSRATLLTGKHSAANGITSNFQALPIESVTFPKLLQHAGYATAIVGKWHLRSEPQGFDGAAVIPGHGRFIDSPFRMFGQFKEIYSEAPKGYLTDVITDLSIDWMKRHQASGDDRPFCIMIQHKAPHEPYIHQPRHEALFADEVMPEPETLYDDWRTREPLRTRKLGASKLIHCIWKRYAQLLATLPTERHERTRQFYQVVVKGHLRLIASLDENVGRVLDYLDASGLAENTIVIYTSDNGFFLGEHGLYNKMWMYEEALHVPLLVRWPGQVAAGAVNDELVSMLDVGPTVLDIAGAKAPDDWHGRSIAPLLQGHTPDDWRDAVYYHTYNYHDLPEHYGIRTHDYKLIRFPELGEYGELFDLRVDPNELVNRYDDPALGDVRRRLSRQLDALRHRFDEQ